MKKIMRRKKTADATMASPRFPRRLTISSTNGARHPLFGGPYSMD